MGQKIQLSESQLCNLIKESVKKALVKEWRELTAAEKEWRDIEQEREDKKRAKENADAVEKSKFAKKMFAQKSDNEGNSEPGAKKNDNNERMARIRRLLGGETGNLNEISVDTMRNARDKFNDVYKDKWVTEVDPNTNIRIARPHRKPTKDGRPMWDHLKDFNDAITPAELEVVKELSDDELKERAKQLWARYQNDAEFEEYDRDGGEVYGNVFLEVDGWEFSADGTGFGHRDYNLDWEVAGDVEFTAPDGRSGVLD